MNFTLKRRASRGFTLIELMITVAIIAILASVAYPAYTSYIRKGKRATAQAALMDLASKEQTYLLDRRAYAGSLTTLSFSAPGEISTAYTFSVACNPVDCSGFKATASPIGSQMASDEQTLAIWNTGAKEPANTRGYWGN